MPVYSDSETYYTNMRTLFACIRENYPKAMDDLGNSKMNIRIHTTAPSADVMILGREKPVRTSYGENGVKPDLEIQATGDVFHEILLGNLGLRSALGSGQLKVKGPIWKALSLADLFHVTQRCYPDIVKGQSQE